MAAFMVFLFSCISVFIFSAVIGTAISVPGVIAAALFTATVFGSADFSLYLIRGPLAKASRKLLQVRELGALVIILLMFALVAGISGSVIWAWANLAPVAFVKAPIAASEAFRLGGSVALLDGFLNWIGFPNRFASLGLIFERHRPRDQN